MHCIIKKSSRFHRSYYFVLNQLSTGISLSYFKITESITACAVLPVSAALYFASVVFMRLINKTQVKLLSQLSVYIKTHRLLSYINFD